MKIFNPVRLTQARNWNNYSLEYLAGKIGVTKASIGLYEKGARKPDEFVQIRLADALHFPIEFFYKPAFSTSNSRISYRKKSSTQKKTENRVELLKQFSIEFTDMLSGYVNFKESLIEPLDVSFEELTNSDIEDIALKLREEFNAGLGPINNLMTFLENRGAFIFVYDNSIADVDGFSCMYSSHPYIFINSDMAWDRMRFTLAHELGHIILHSGVDDSERQNKDLYKVIEAQANVFAGAFLFPKTSFVNEFMGINNNFLLELKKKWGMSKSSLVMRARLLDIISETQESSFFVGASRRKELKVEEGANLREKESPFLIEAVVNTLLQKNVDFYTLKSQSGLPEELLYTISSKTLIDKKEENRYPFALNFK